MRERESKRLRRFVTTFFLILSLLLQNFLFLVNPVYAASSPWAQTDWVGGSGQTNWSDATKYSTGSNITDSTAGQLTLSPTSGWCSNASCDSSWKYRKKITFDNTDANLGVTSENLVNFPVLVKLSSSNIDYTKTQDSGQDIRFTDTDGSDLAYEIEKWDEIGTSWVWVKVPQIDINSSTDYIYLYYGNTSATDHQQATSVWDSNYKGVWHLPNGTTLTANDSTSNANNGTITGATAATGQIDGAASFNGSSGQISIGTSNLATGAHSVTLWVYTANDGDSALFEFQLDSLGFISYKDSLERVIFGHRSGIQPYTANGSFNLGQWNYLASVYNGGSKTSSSSYKTYINGVDSATTLPYGLIGGSFTTNYIGREGNSYGNSTIDDVRISNSARSAAWIAATYKSETDAFNTFNSEEERYVSSGTLTSSIFDTEQQSNWGTLTYNTDGVATTAVKARTSNSSSMVGATDFASCNAITSGSDISSNNCVTDTHRYIQYQIGLSSVSANTPTFQDVSIAFTASDGTAPSISLTALSPDPNSDNTPTLSGTATESIGTVSNVQFQMDSTSGSWTACTADDGSFDEASEAFTCTPPAGGSTLTDGSHTMYVRATDSNGNTTSSGYASDTFTIDATAPVSIELDNPGDNSYTNSERPSFKWKATTDATAGLSKYVLEIDPPSLSASEGQATRITIDNIPTSRTTDYETNKYVIHYENFSDSDSTNNYISVYTKSSSDWGSSENDGKLREGRVSWKVKTVDNAGNETSSSRILFVDRTNPHVEFTQINSTPYTSNNFSTTDKTPTIFGKITDFLSGGDSSNPPAGGQDENGPRIASAPKEVNLKIEKKTGLTYSLVTLYKINMDPSASSGQGNPYYTCDTGKTIDNSKQKCDKYLPFEYTPKENLDYGTYKITLTGKDKADNSSSETTLILNITTLAQITTPEEKKIIEEEIKPLKPEEQEKVKEELEITKPTEPVKPSALEKTVDMLTVFRDNLFNSAVSLAKNISSGIGKGVTITFNGIGNGAKFIFDTTGHALAFAGDKAGQAIAFVGHGIQTTFNAVGQGLAFTKDNTGKAIAFIGKVTGNGVSALYNSTTSIAALVGQGAKTGAGAIGQGLAFIGQKAGEGISSAAQTTGTLLATIGQNVSNTGKAASNAVATIGDGYNQLANNAPAVAKIILTGIGNGVSTTGKAIASVASTASNATAAVASTTVKIAQTTASAIGNAANYTATTTSTIAQNTTKTIETIASNIGTTIANVSKSIANTTSTFAQNTSKTIGNVTGLIAGTTGSIAQKTGSAIASTAQNTVKATKEGLANVAFSVGEKTQDVSDSLGYSIVQLGYLFVNEPTKITAVQVEALSPTSVKISWVTNHPANGKINYGLDRTYPFDFQSEKRVTYHEYALTNLNPDTLYYFEVMSHNKNYVYDANREFKTPAVAGWTNPLN